MGNRVVNFIPIKQGIYEISSTSKGDIGSLMEFEDGRKFVYSLNGADTLTPGAFIQGPVENASDEAIAIAVSGVVGDTTITITTGRSIAANEFKDGYLVIEDTAAGVIGHMRKIKSHPAADSSASLVITVYDAFTDTTTAGTDTVNMIENPYNGVMLNNSTTDGPLLGVAPCDVTAAYYFWLQVAGPCSMIAGEASLKVGGLVVVDAVAGTAMIPNTSGDAEYVGWAMQDSEDGNALLVWLMMR